MKGIIPANELSDLGTFWDYFPIGQVRTNAAHTREVLVPNRSYALASVDIVTYALSDGHVLMIECFDCMVVAFERLSDGAIQGVQCWVQVGNKDDSGNFFPCNPAYFTPKPYGGKVESYIHFDLNNDGKPDNNEASFRVLVPDDLGIPWVLHEFYDQSYVIEAWFVQQAQRMFWAARHQNVQTVDNPYWTGDSEYIKPATYYQEAFWEEYSGWTTGDGQAVLGRGWPHAYTYGRYESHARGVSSLWYVHEWKPVDGRDQYALFREET